MRSAYPPYCIFGSDGVFVGWISTAHPPIEQHAPFPGAPVAAEQVEGEAEKVHFQFIIYCRLPSNRAPFLKLCVIVKQIFDILFEQRHLMDKTSQECLIAAPYA